MDGVYMVGVSAEHRAGAGVTGGDEVDVEIELDTAPREVSVPDDLAAALDAEPMARATFDGLSYSNSRGTSSRSPEPRPMRRVSAASASQSRCYAKAAPARTVTCA